MLNSEVLTVPPEARGNCSSSFSEAAKLLKIARARCSSRVEPSYSLHRSHSCGSGARCNSVPRGTWTSPGTRVSHWTDSHQEHRISYVVAVEAPGSGVKMASMVVVLLVVSMFNLASAFDSPSGFPVPSYFVMGDEFHDAGNNNFIADNVPKANFQPYGMTFFKKPTGRFTDGRLISDLIAKIMLLPQAPPSLSNITIVQKGTCINYASGGSAILPASSAAYGAKNAFSFKQQVMQYEGHAVDVIYEYGVDQALLVLNDAIYQLNFGTTDLLAYFTNPKHAATSGPISVFVQALATEYLQMVERLYSQGARKVVVFGIGPIQKSPLGRLLSSKMTLEAGKKWCSEIDSAARQLNKKLQAMVTKINANNGLDQAYASLQLVFADTYGAIMDIQKNPKNYGFENVSKACCGGGKFGAEFLCGSKRSQTCRAVSKSLYWNSMQFTEAGTKQLFKLFFGGSRFVKPFSIKHLCRLLIPGVPY